MKLSLGKDSEEALVHNMRAAFVAGLGYGMEKVVLLIQQGDDPVPLDFRDFVKRANALSQIDGFIAEFAPIVMDLLQSESGSSLVGKQSLLEQISLGASTAENEMGNLNEYYLETAEFVRALRGEGQIVTGWKGSGKTAIFLQARNRLRKDRRKVVLDLMPEGYQLLKFKDVVLSNMEQGTKEHTITAFWDYLLHLEICHRILEDDRDRHLRNHDLTDLYRDLASEYGTDDFVSEGDFAERVLMLTKRIETEIQRFPPSDQGENRRLNTDQITNVIYKHDIKELKSKLTAYLENKDGVWILIDNLDKGWPATGLGADDLMILRCLLDAISKLQKYFQRKEIECHGVVFLRNDIYDLILEYTPDRGKLSRIAIDWSDIELLRQMLRKRLMKTKELSEASDFETMWRSIAAPIVAGEESSCYLIERSLMRPRFLLDLVNSCKSHAVNLGHQKIEESDIFRGEELYSSDLVANIGFEIRDVCPMAEDVLYAFIDEPSRLPTDKLVELLQVKGGIELAQTEQVIDYLLWYSVLGVVKSDGEVAYISGVRYDKKKLRSIIQNSNNGKPVFQINPAFWKGLSISVVS